MRTGINTEIALTYLLSRKKQTGVAALGVTFGISMYIFMNSLIAGTNDYFEKVTLSTTPHVRLYSDNKMSNASLLQTYLQDGRIKIISNPKLTASDNRIKDPFKLIHSLKTDREVMALSAQVSSNVIYTYSGVDRNGTVYGVNILEQDKMFDITSTLLTGKTDDLQNTPDGIIIGAGLASDLNVKKGNYITLTASNGMAKRLRVVGIFKTTIKAIDNTKTYVNVPVAEQLLKKDRSYITEIYINIKDYTQAPQFARKAEQLTGYQAEDWQGANEQSVAARKIRDVIANSVVVTILIVAGFGIYNILNMTIYEKIKEIAILKATGFAGTHVISIFIRQAMFIGLIGSFMGLALGWTLALLVSKLYIGMGNVSYLPMAFKIPHYIQGFVFGVITTFFAGYIPAVKASKVDPVQIIRG
jgi:lipoprotein-releasing system permease protein